MHYEIQIKNKIKTIKYKNYKIIIRKSLKYTKQFKHSEFHNFIHISYANEIKEKHLP